MAKPIVSQENDGMAKPVVSQGNDGMAKLTPAGEYTRIRRRMQCSEMNRKVMQALQLHLNREKGAA